MENNDLFIPREFQVGISPLAEFSFDDIFNELERRFEGFIFVGYEAMQSDDKDTSIAWFHGSTPIQVGLETMLTDGYFDKSNTINNE